MYIIIIIIVIILSMKYIHTVGWGVGKNLKD